MAAAPRIANLAAIDALDAIVDLIDGGDSNGYIEIRTGAPPATCETASSGTLLATLALSDPAFGGAADDDPDAIATADTITEDAEADNGGTAGHFRVFDSDDVCIIQGTVAESDADMIIDNEVINAGQTVQITAYTVTLPEAG